MSGSRSGLEIIMDTDPVSPESLDLINIRPDPKPCLRWLLCPFISVCLLDITVRLLWTYFSLDHLFSVDAILFHWQSPLQIYLSICIFIQGQVFSVLWTCFILFLSKKRNPFFNSFYCLFLYQAQTALL